MEFWQTPCGLAKIWRVFKT